MTLQPLTKPQIVPIKLIFKPPSAKDIDVHNTQSNETERISITTVNRAVNVPLCDKTRKEFIRFFHHYNIGQNEVTRALDEALQKYDTSNWLNCTLNRWCYHGRTLLEFAEQPNSIIIRPRNDESIYQVHESLLNQYWRVNGHPYRIVRSRTVLSEA